jgi:hypothetical protein
MSNKIFKTDHGNVPLLTKENYPGQKQNIHQVRIGKRVNNIITGVELLRVGTVDALHPLGESWYSRASKAPAQIHLGCSDELHPFIDDIDDPVAILGYT